MPKPTRRARARTAPRRLGAVLLCLIVATTLGYGAVRETNDPRFRVGPVHVEGNLRTTAAEIRAAAALARSQNAWLIDRAALRSRIEALPWVQTAAIGVSWPNAVRIAVTERQPVARVMLAASALSEEPVRRDALIDKTQRVLALEPWTKDRFGDPPLLLIEPPPSDAVRPGSRLSQAEVGAAVQALTALQALHLEISQVAIAPATGISARADRDLHVLFGDNEDLAKKAALFQAIVAKISTPRQVVYVDVRSLHAPTVLYR